MTKGGGPGGSGGSRGDEGSAVIRTVIPSEVEGSLSDSGGGGDEEGVVASGDPAARGERDVALPDDVVESGGTNRITSA